LSIGGLKERALTSLYRRPGVLPQGRHLITFTFDDFNSSAYIIGGKMLADAGARGTYYAAMGLMNSGPDMFSADEARQLVADGHDLQCHTYGHLSSREHPIAAYRADIERGKAAIAALRPDGRCDHFAYPYGHVTLAAKRALRGAFTTCRSNRSGVNWPVADLNLLLANKLYSDSIPLSAVEEIVERARREGGWLIFYSHDISAQPTRYGCTPQYFEAAVGYATKSGAQIVTISDAVKLIQAARP